MCSNLSLGLTPSLTQLSSTPFFHRRTSSTRAALRRLNAEGISPSISLSAHSDSPCSSSPCSIVPYKRAHSRAQSTNNNCKPTALQSARLPLLVTTASCAADNIGNMLPEHETATHATAEHATAEDATDEDATAAAEESRAHAQGKGLGVMWRQGIGASVMSNVAVLWSSNCNQQASAEAGDGSNPLEGLLAGDSPIPFFTGEITGYWFLDVFLVMNIVLLLGLLVITTFKTTPHEESQTPESSTIEEETETH